MNQITQARITHRTSDQHVYLGIDPGKDGAIVAIDERDKVHVLTLGNSTEQQIWFWMGQWINMPGYAVIEQIVARPTRFKQGAEWASSVLASTCYLYGSFCQLRAFLTAIEIPFEETIPQTWQKHYGMKRGIGETDAHWKTRLRRRAEQMFPREQISKSAADAFLIAKYCRHTTRGTVYAKNC
jgi:hypothetical protein